MYNSYKAVIPVDACERDVSLHSRPALTPLLFFVAKLARMQDIFFSVAAVVLLKNVSKRNRQKSSRIQLYLQM